jgi:cobalt-zinc-cadmium efflux system membrane fusion protein
MLKQFSLLLMVVAGAAYVAGCNKTDEPAAVIAAQTPAAPQDDGWWCAEHGVPEEVCTRCNPKLVANFKAKGDWCTKHDCPESQCFICHPEKEGEFAALYEAKYGHAPPKPGTGEHEHEHNG